MRTIKDLNADEHRQLELSTVTIISKRSEGAGALVEALHRMHSLTPLAEVVHGV